MSRIMNFIRNINYLTKCSLWEQREEDIIYLTNKILDDGMYEYKIFNTQDTIPRIMTRDESLDEIIKTGKSFVRTGDGECKIIMGLDQPFQRYEKEIDERLREILSNPSEDLLVGINRNYYIPLNGRMNLDYYIRNAYDFRKIYAKFLNRHVRYIDATFISCQDVTIHNSETDAYYDKWCQLFKGKDIAIVCGEGILDSMKYDVFYKARSKCFIYGPRINAWSEHDRLMAKITKNVPQSTIIIFILGMAGKAMIPELMKQGYICWDVGHLAKYYDAYMSGAVWTREFRDKFYAPD